MPKKLAGYFPIMATPYRKDGQVDLASTRRLTEFLIQNGAQGMSPNGGDSEGRFLTEEERMRLTDAVVETNNGRTPVLVGTTSLDVEESARLSRYAEKAGADAIFVMPSWDAWDPTKFTQEEMLARYDTILDGLTIPIMIHATPGMDVPFLEKLIARYPAIQYIKEETTHGPKLRDYIQRLGHRVTIFGPGVQYPAELGWGAMGVMPSCLAPDLHGKIFDLWQAGQHDEARRVWNRLLPLVFWRWHTSAQEAGKLYLKHLGVFETSYTRPDHGQLKLDEADQQEMLRVLEELGQ